MADSASQSEKLIDEVSPENRVVETNGSSQEDVDVRLFIHI